jgi:hypothetical protein
LIEAARVNALEIVKVLAAHPGVDLNARDEGQRTALAVAALAGWLEIVQFLVGLPGVQVDRGLRSAVAESNPDIAELLTPK